MKKQNPYTYSNLLTPFNFKSLVWAFGLSLLCYAPFLINFMWGNHDWQWIKELTPLWSGVFEGRFSQFFMQVLLFDGKILPIFTLLSALFLFSVATILLLNLWDIPQKTIYFILLALSLTTAPYTISWLYFAFIMLSCLSWSLFIIIGYWFLIHKNLKISVPLAALFFTLALGGYPPVINLISVIFFSLILNDISFQKLSPAKILRKYYPCVIAIVLALVCFLSIQHFLKKIGLQYATYNTANITLSGLLEKSPVIFTALFKQFTTTTSFLYSFYKISWLAITLMGFSVLYHKTTKNLSTSILFGCATLGMLLSSLITLIIAQNSEYVLFEPRIEFFGLLYIYIFSASVLLKSKNLLLKNITTFLLSGLLFYNFTTLSYSAKVWKLGFESETKLMERIIKRIEDTPNFNKMNTYTFVQGGAYDFRSRYYKNNTTNVDSYTLTAPYIPWHLPSKAYKFYYPKDFFGDDFDIFWSFVNPQQLTLSPELITYLQYGSTPWPHKNAIYLDNNTIILTLTPTGKEQASFWINN